MPGGRPSGPAAAAGLDFRIIPVGFNAPLEFLTGFTKWKWGSIKKSPFIYLSKGVTRSKKYKVM